MKPFVLNRSASPRRVTVQSGVSMVELLVALLIFSFGMLGLAGLQTRTLSFNQSSLYRSQATALADDLLDRMRVDRSNAISGAYDSAITVKSTDITAGSVLATNEMKDWKAQVESLLPDSRASVAINTPSAGSATITIEWDDSRGRDAKQSWQTISRL
jgi:type IV pilus assembly protein PilV